METVKKLEEKLVLNQPKIDHDDSIREKSSGQVKISISCVSFLQQEPFTVDDQCC